MSKSRDRLIDQLDQLSIMITSIKNPNLNDGQIDVKEIQEMIANGDKQVADKIMRYGEGLRGSRQFWIA